MYATVVVAINVVMLVQLVQEIPLHVRAVFLDLSKWQIIHVKLALSLVLHVQVKTKQSAIHAPPDTTQTTIPVVNVQKHA